MSATVSDLDSASKSLAVTEKNRGRKQPAIPS
jgi:hypothetical protein